MEVGRRLGPLGVTVTTHPVNPSATRAHADLLEAPRGNGPGQPNALDVFTRALRHSVIDDGIIGAPRPLTLQERTDENLKVSGILVGATTTGAGIGTAIPGVGTVAGAAAGAICGLIASYFYARNNENNRRRN